jgi:transcriptional regulator with XRE-family HTH domain
MIGEEIRRRRQEKGLTGVQLAAKAGMAPSAVSQIETGRRTPNSASVIKLAEALECEVADLFPKALQARLPLEEPFRRLISRPGVQDWLRERDAKFAGMSGEEFADYLRELSTGDKEPDERERAFDRLLSDMEAEREATRRFLRDELKYGGPLFKKVSFDTPEDEQRSIRDAQENWRLERELMSRYNYLLRLAARFSRLLYEANLMPNYLVDPRDKKEELERALQRTYAEEGAA